MFFDELRAFACAGLISAGMYMHTRDIERFITQVGVVTA